MSVTLGLFRWQVLLGYLPKCVSGERHLGLNFGRSGNFSCPVVHLNGTCVPGFPDQAQWPGHTPWGGMTVSQVPGGTCEKLVSVSWRKLFPSQPHRVALQVSCTFELLGLLGLFFDFSELQNLQTNLERN